MLDVDPAKVVKKGRLQPGRMFLVDTAQGRIVDDEEIKADARRRAPVRASGSTPGSCTSTTCPTASTWCCSHESVLRRQQVFGYTHEELKLLVAPMAQGRRRSRSARWAPTRRSPCCPTGRACCSTTSSSCSRRSPTRRSTPSARSWSRRCRSHDRARGQPARPRPGVVPPDRAAVPDHRQRRARQAHPHRRRRRHARLRGARRSTACTASPTAASRCARRSTSVRARGVSEAIADGARIIVLSDRYSNAELAPIPSLLLTSAVHHHLIREKTRTQVGLVVESRRRARGAPHGAAPRLRRRRHQPVPRVRVDRGPDRRRACTGSAAPTRTRRSRTTSRPPARACSR